MGASFDNWLRGGAMLLAGIAFLFLLGWIFAAFGIVVPREIRRVLTWVFALILVRLVLSQIFD